MPSPLSSLSRAAVVVTGIAVAHGVLVGCTGDLELPPSVVALEIGVSGPWEAKTIHPIRWQVPTDLGPLDPTVTLTVSHDSGASWFELEELALEDRYYRWTVPEGYEKARLGLLFHHTDESGVLKDLRLAETTDVRIAPTAERRYTWEMMVDNAPFGTRDGAGGIVHDGKMWLIGGWDPWRFKMQNANDVWSSEDGKTWTEVKKNTFGDPAFDKKNDWEGRHFAGYHAFGGKMWIVGGDANQGYYQTDVWSSVDGKTWQRHDEHTVTPRINKATGEPYPEGDWPPVEEAQYGMRTAAITGIMDGRIFLMGGQRVTIMVDPEWPGAPSKLFDDVWTSNNGATFQQVPASGPRWSPRGFVSEAPVYDGKMWVVGGGLHEDPPAGRPTREYNNDVWTTKDGAAWERIVEEPPFSPRIWHNVKEFDGRLWVINGFDGDTAGQGRAADNLGDVWYTADGRNWYPSHPPESFIPRHAGTAWVHRDALYVGSGNEIVGGRWYADVWRMKRAP